jgi:phosphoserine phosphatase
MNLALFDFDGTITNGHLFQLPPFRSAPASSRPGSTSPHPLAVCYRLGLVAAHQARPIVSRVGFQGEPADSIRQLGCRYAEEVLPAVIRKRALERIQWHQTQGDRVVVVSASLDAYPPR